jgi:hypothetical protein
MTYDAKENSVYEGSPLSFTNSRVGRQNIGAIRQRMRMKLIRAACILRLLFRGTKLS